MNEDLSNIFEKFNINKDSISPEMIDNVMSMLNNNSDNESNSTYSNNSNSENAIDFETILKFKSLFEKMNSKDDPRSKLLLSLRPYLKQSKQTKLDQYIQMSRIIELLPFISGDNNASK